MKPKTDPFFTLTVALACASVASTLRLLNTEREKITEITDALLNCSPQELPTVLNLFNSYAQVRAMEISLFSWDEQRKKEQEKSNIDSLVNVRKLLS